MTELEAREYWESTRVFFDGDTYFSSMLEDIRNARFTIQIEVYIFTLDPLSRILLTELQKARERNVLVQLLVDGFGSLANSQEIERFCQKNQIDFRVFRPLPFTRKSKFLFILWKYGIHIRRFLRRVNKRNHRKIVLIDGKIAYLGSLNITQPHSRAQMGDLAWRDTAVRLEGPPLRHLGYSMAETWKFHRSLRPFRFMKNPLWHYIPTKSLVRLNTRRSWRRILNHNFIYRIRNAKERVLLTSAYFLPTHPLLVALEESAKRGVRVEILVPGPSDVPLVKLAALSLYHRLHKAGAQIFQYQRSVLHAKSFVIDHYFLIGSTNLNHRSFLHDLEVEAQITNSEVQYQLLSQWDLDLTVSKKFSDEEYRQLSLLTRIVARIAFRFRYWL